LAISLAYPSGEDGGYFNQRAAPRNAANTFPDFSAGLSQNSVMVKKIQQLVEKHEKLTICKGS
jgi:hypothetical protein